MTAAFRLRRAEIRQRRELLVQRAAVQRDELAAVAAEFERPLHLINRVASISGTVAGWMRAQPGAAGFSVLTALLVMTRARRWVGRAVMVYQFVKFLRDRLGAPHAEATLSVRGDMEAT
jgi:hypothetical protein